MKTFCNASFRTYVKNLKPARQNNPLIDENYMGSQHREKTGFFGIYHGDKDNEEGFLRKEVEMAEDGQAIYEFIQNAADCGATHFYMYYDEENFLVINNGEKFSKDGLRSILNVGQSHDKDDCGKIGRFGIGFKLVHRLVGEVSGLREILEDYAGPILFSWTEQQQLLDLLENKWEGESQDFDETLPWLLKICLTNFPATPRETVKDLKFEERVPFNLQELSQMIGFIKSRDKIDFNKLTRGSLFYLRLGKGKQALLKDNEDDLKEGVQCSMHFLQKLNRVVINGKDVEKLSLLSVDDEITIEKDSDEFKTIKLEDAKEKKCPVKIQYGYVDYRKAQILKSSPSYYKYFPMGNETNHLAFIIHCSVFNIKSDRRALHEGPTNKRLFELFSQKLLERLHSYIDGNPLKFIQIFANILLSEQPKEESKWQYGYLLEPLEKGIKEFIPTDKFYSSVLLSDRIKSDTKYIRVKETALNVTPADVGIPDIEWYFWNNRHEEDMDVLRAGKEKLGLDRFSIADLFLEGGVSDLNSFIENTSEYDLLAKELMGLSSTKWTSDNNKLWNKFLQIKYLQFEDQKFYTLQEIVENKDLLLFSPLWLDYEDYPHIAPILRKLGFMLSQKGVGNDSELGKLIINHVPYLKTVIGFFDYINTKTAENTLEPAGKVQLFKFLSNLNEITQNTTNKLLLFKNRNGVPTKISELISGSEGLPFWLSPYQIAEEEYLAFGADLEELDKHLEQKEEVYKNKILAKWEEICLKATEQPGSIADFYTKVIHYYSLSEDKTPLKGKNFVWTGKAFEAETAAFYFNSALQGHTAFNSISRLLEGILEISCIQAALIPLLQNAPFSLADSNTKKLFEESLDSSFLLDANDVELLIKHFLDAKEDLFEIAVLLSENEGITLQKKENFKQIYTDKKEVLNFLRDNDSSLALLPKQLDHYRSSSFVVKYHELYDLILDEFDPNEYKTELIEIIHYDAIEKFLIAIDEIIIDIDNLKSYNMNSFEFRYLYKTSSKITKEIAAHVSEILQLKKDGELFSVKGLPYSSEKIEFTFQHNSKVYELQVNEILEDSQKRTAQAEAVLIYFEGLGIDRNKLIVLLGLSDEKENSKNKSNIFNNLNNDLGEEKVIANAAQLAFLMLHAKETENAGNILSTYKLKSSDGNFYALDYTFYLNAYDFMDETAVLDTIYSQVKELLKLSYEHPSFSDGKAKIVLEPYFEGDRFIFDEFKSGDQVDDNIRKSFFKFLFEKWQKNKMAKFVMGKIDWSDLLPEYFNFNPKNILLSELAIEEEQLPEVLKEYNHPAKVEFLFALGVQAADSPIVKLRNFLEKGIGQLPTNFLANFNAESEKELLINSLWRLEAAGMELQEGQKLKLISEIYNCLDFDTETVPMLYVENMDEAGIMCFRLYPNDENDYELSEEKLKDIRSISDEALYNVWYALNDMGTENEQERNKYKLWAKFKYPDSWADELDCEKIEISEPEIDFTTLKTNSPKWTSQYYLSWCQICTSEVDIHISESIETEKLFLGYIIDKTEVDDIQTDEAGNIYVPKKMAKDEKLLIMQLALKKHISEQDAMLFLDILQNKKPLQPDEDEYIDIIDVDGLSGPNKKAHSDEAKKKAKQKLQDMGFDLTNWYDDFTYISGIIDPNGIERKIIIKSAKAGNLFINPGEWVHLNQPNAMLLVYDGKNVQPVSFEELFMEGTRFQISVLADSFTPEGIASFGEVFRYVPGVTFVIESPNFSYAGWFDSFGLYQTKDGEAAINDDDYLNE